MTWAAAVDNRRPWRAAVKAHDRDAAGVVEASYALARSNLSSADVTASISFFVVIRQRPNGQFGGSQFSEPTATLAKNGYSSFGQDVLYAASPLNRSVPYILNVRSFTGTKLTPSFRSWLAVGLASSVRSTTWKPM